MSRKNILRVLLSVLLVAAVMVSMSAAAFAEEAEFSFELPKDFEVNDVIILSEKSGENSVKEKAPWLFEEYTGAEVAEFVAYDRYLKGESYAYELDEENGFVIFGITGPTTILVPSKIEFPEKGNLDMTVLCIDIPDGTELDITYTDGTYAGTAKAVAEDGIAQFTIYRNALQKLADAEELEVTIDYTVDGQDYSDTAKYPVGDGDDKIIYEDDNGEAKPAEEPEKEPEEEDNSKKHGIVIVGGGSELDINVNEDKIFDKTDVELGKNDGAPEVQIWYNGQSFNIPLDPNVIINLFK